VVTPTSKLVRWTGSEWEKIPGSAKEIGIGMEGSVVVLGGRKKSDSSDYSIWKWQNSKRKWHKIGGPAA